MRLLLFGNYSAGDGYPRLRVLAEGLRRNGIEVVEHREPWLEGEGTRRQAAGSIAGLLAAGVGALRIRGRLKEAYRAAPAHDAVLVGYPGHLAVPAVRRAGVPAGVPVLLDAFLSLHDTIVEDRGLVPADSVRARLFRRLDERACRAADLVLVDTDAHADRFHAALGVPRDRLRTVPVGALAPSGGAASLPDRSAATPLEVLWFGTYVPLQGVSTVVDAVALLVGKGVRVTLVGKGQELKAVRRRADEHGIGRDTLAFVPEFVPRAELDRRLAACDVGLGIFGTTAKAARVVPCKVHDTLAAGRPVVTADTPAARELLADGVDARLVPAGDSPALAAALLELRDDRALRQRLADGALALWRERLAPERVAAALADELKARCRPDGTA